MENGVFGPLLGVIKGHSRSLEIATFDRVHTSSYIILA